MRPCQAPLCQGSISARYVGLYPNPTNVDGKDSRVILRTSSRTIGEDGLKPKPNPEKETKERNLEKVKEENLPDSNYKIPKTHRSACDHQLCQMAVRCKLHNSLAFYSTTRD